MAGLRTEKALREAIARRLSRTLPTDACGVEPAWPWTLAVGRPSSRELLAHLDELDVLIRALRSWEARTDARVEYEMREAGGPKRVPVRVLIPSAPTACELAGTRGTKGTKGAERWADALRRTCVRRDLVREALPHVADDVCARVLRSTDSWDDLQFELLLAAGSWFAAHDASGLTPRQVPLPGIDAKWLDAARNRTLVCLLAGKDDLGLRGRPALLEFAYLDPEHLAAGRRRYDTWMEGDACELAYVPDVCVIVENKDTYLSYPPVRRGICVFGAGKAGMAFVSRFEGVQRARKVLYWGDLDADGFEILNGYRERGVDCESMLMDLATLERYERYGTSLEKDHKTQIVRERRDLPHLSEQERAAYERLTDPLWPGHRRIEQEKIPYDALP